jgi:hypothetical protein
MSSGVTVAQCKTATVRVYKGKDYKYAKMSTGKARRGAVAQWATPFMGPQFKSSSALPPQYAIFGLNTSHEPLANPVRSH